MENTRPKLTDPAEYKIIKSIYFKDRTYADDIDPQEKLDRIESILPTLEIIRLKEVINSIADNMLDDGFEYSDVKEYIKTHLTEILGK
jgi:hypothetical protein